MKLGKVGIRGTFVGHAIYCSRGKRKTKRWEIGSPSLRGAIVLDRDEQFGWIRAPARPKCLAQLNLGCAGSSHF